RGINPCRRSCDRRPGRIIGLVTDVADVDPAESRGVFGGARERPVAGRGEQRGDGETHPVESHAQDQRGDDRAVHPNPLALRAAQQQRPSERRMDWCSPWLVHQNVAPAQPTAVMKLSAPRASAPPKATPNRRRAPDPCSVNANTRPVTMTATVISTCATVPLRLLRIVFSGPSQGIAGPVAAASATELTVSRRRTLQQTGRINRRR